MGTKSLSGNDSRHSLRLTVDPLRILAPGCASRTDICRRQWWRPDCGGRGPSPPGRCRVRSGQKVVEMIIFLRDFWNQEHPVTKQK